MLVTGALFILAVLLQHECRFPQWWSEATLQVAVPASRQIPVLQCTSLASVVKGENHLPRRALLAQRLRELAGLLLVLMVALPPT